MAVVLVVVCARCSGEFRSERARSEGSARTRAAAHGWVQVPQRGLVLDVCPACTQGALPAAQRAAAEAVTPPQGMPVVAAGVPRPVGPVHPVALLADDAELCSWCEAGDCSWCTGCECTSARHARVPAAV